MNYRYQVQQKNRFTTVRMRADQSRQQAKGYLVQLYLIHRPYPQKEKHVNLVRLSLIKSQSLCSLRLQLDTTAEHLRYVCYTWRQVNSIKPPLWHEISMEGKRHQNILLFLCSLNVEPIMFWVWQYWTLQQYSLQNLERKISLVEMKFLTENQSKNKRILQSRRKWGNFSGGTLHGSHLGPIRMCVCACVRVCS